MSHFGEIADLPVRTYDQEKGFANPTEQAILYVDGAKFHGDALGHYGPARDFEAEYDDEEKEEEDDDPLAAALEREDVVLPEHQYRPRTLRAVLALGVRTGTKAKRPQALLLTCPMCIGFLLYSFSGIFKC